MSENFIIESSRSRLLIEKDHKNEAFSLLGGIGLFSIFAITLYGIAFSEDGFLLIPFLFAIIFTIPVLFFILAIIYPTKVKLIFEKATSNLEFNNKLNYSFEDLLDPTVLKIDDTEGPTVYRLFIPVKDGSKIDIFLTHELDEILSLANTISTFIDRPVKRID